MENMSGTEAKRAKKRRNKKTSKSITNSATNFPDQQTPVTSSGASNFHPELQRIIDEVSDEPFGSGLSPLGPNPYLDVDKCLGVERCLLCRCERPHSATLDNIDGEDDMSRSENGSLAQLPLWVCPECRRTVEEEEKRAAESALLKPDLRMDGPLPLMSELGGAEPTTANGTVCTCEACTERRQIEAEHEKETQELQQCWMELRHVVRCVYREAGTGLSENTLEQDAHLSALPDINKMKELVHRLSTRDPHQLYQRLESQGREYVIEMKVRLLKQLTSGHKTPLQAKQFVAMLLEEYSNLCTAAKTLASFLNELEQEHLKRFNLTWELHNKHMFQSIIYSDPVVQNSLPMLITQLRLGAASKESYHEDTYPNILHRYLKFDDEMSVISVVWRDCHQLLDEYNEEQATLKAKQKMLKEDWEFFKAQRKLLEKQVLKSKGGGNTQTHDFEAQFTETMRHILQGTKPVGDECHCPNCNRKRCSCDECTISHMITCGIISPEVAEQMPAHNPLAFPHDPSRYIIDVTPPSMSSTSSSSGSSSPITVDPERLTLPFDDCPENFELEDDDDIPEELEGDEQGDHFDDSNKSDHGSITEERDEQEGEQGGDEDVEEEEEDEEEEDYAEDDEDEEEDDDDDEEDEEDDEEEDDIDEDELLGQVEELGGENQLDGQALSQLALPLPLGPLIPQQNNSQKVESCDCTHCTQAKVEQAKQVEEASNQCQCHACLQQAGQGVATSLPQQLPTAPRPAALHLYPHIHGSNSLHTSPGMHNHAPHMRQVMQPHLYELHNGARPQGKNLLQQQKKHSTAYNLDLDSHEALHEHIHNAYGDWDNSYDATKLMLAPHKFGSSLSSELFSPVPPLMNGAQFVGDTLMSSADTSLASGLKSSGVLQHASLANLPVVNSQMTNTMTASNALLTTTTVAGTQGNEHVHTEACFKSMKAQSHALLNPVQSPTRQKVPMMPNVSSLASNSSVPMVLSNSMANNGGLIQTPHSDHCLKHNPFLHTHHSSFSSTHSTNTITSAPAVPTHPLPMKLTPELIRSAAISAGKDPVMGGVNMNPGAATPLNLPLTCNHAHMHNNQPITQLAGARNPQADLANAAGAGGAMNNVSVGTSTVCQDPDCDGHHEDDSVDDSCSEQSSSTSTSAQKDGKYCDCCYCEFFGHSNPPMAPTSRNYAEMRDRLRLRLKKKNEQKGSSVEPENIVVVEEEVPQPEEVEDQRGLDELIRFINGDEDDKNLEKLNAKAAKRARQKQRKAEEKARREAEERAQQLAEEQRRRAEEEAKRKLLNQETSKKKRGKHKDRKDNHLQVQKVHNNQLHSQNQTNLQQRRTSPTEGTSHNNKNGRQGNSAKVVNQCDIAKSESSQPNEGVNVNGGMQNPASRPRAKKENINATSSLKPDKSKKSNGKQPDSPKSPAPSLNRSSDGKGDTGNKASLSSQQPQASFTSRAQQQANQTHITPVNKQQHQNNNKTHTNNNTKNQQQPQTSSTQQQKITAQQQHIAAQQQIAAQNKQIAAQNKQIAAQNKQIAAEQHQAAVHQLLIKEHLAAQQVQAKKKNNKKSTQQQHQQHVQNQQLPNTQQRHQQYQNQHPASNPTVNQPGRQIRANLPQQDNHQQHQQINHVHMMNGSNQHHHQQEVRNGGPGMPREERRMAKPLSPRDAKEARSKASSEDRSPPKTNDQNSRGTAKSKRPKRKNKHADDLDEIFKPRVDLDLDNGDIDEFEREIEEFKRFCMDTKPGEKKERLQVNMNLKDIFQKKKSGVSCA